MTNADKKKFDLFSGTFLFGSTHSKLRPNLIGFLQVNNKCGLWLFFSNRIKYRERESERKTKTNLLDEDIRSDFVCIFRYFVGNSRISMCVCVCACAHLKFIIVQI